MVDVRTFTIRHENNASFTVDSIFTREEMARLLAGYEEELGPHKTLNVIPEFPIISGFGSIPPHHYCENGEVVALHCIATF